MCRAMSSQGSVSVRETAVTCAGERVSWAASSGSAIFITPSARLVAAVKATRTAVLRRPESAPVSRPVATGPGTPPKSACAGAVVVMAIPLVVSATRNLSTTNSHRLTR